MPISIIRRSASRQIRDAQARAATILDVTSKGPQPWVRFSPFYPHGGIPVPLSEGYSTASVEGAWQALKVFEAADVDLSRMRVVDMKGLKRSERSFGRVRGHRAGVGSPRLLSYLEARQQLYLPLYRWVLEHHVADLVARLRAMSSQGTVVLLDYQTNGDVADLSSPLSHAALIKAFVEDRWPG